MAAGAPVRAVIPVAETLVDQPAGGPGDHREANDGLAVVRTLDRLTESLRG